MFTNVSMTGTGILTIILSYILSVLGVNAETSQIASWVASMINLLGLIWVIWGQLRRKDLSVGFFRK